VSDIKNEAHEFVGSGRDEAVRKACQYFGVEDESALVISGFQPGTVSGLAGRALVVAVPKGRAGAAPQRARGESGHRDEEERGNSGRGGRDPNRRRDRDRGERARESAPRARDEGEPSARPRRERDPRGDRGRRQAPETEGAAEDTRPSTGTAIGDLGEIGQFLSGTIERMNLGSFQISETTEGEIIVVQVKGAAAAKISAGQGRTVDALQLLANQVSARVSSDRQRVVIDVEGDVDARQEFLERLAERVASRALQTGRPVALDPMNARDRRLIHVALRDRDDVATISEGEGRYRQVVVVPESSDEFEEARAQSERSSGDR
jgi:spoIIIJ-associated protein